MRLRRWTRKLAKVEAPHGSSSAEQVSIQRELARLDMEVAAMRGEIAALKSAASPWPGRLATEISRAGQAAVGQAMDNFARALRRSAPVRGRAGGLACATGAWRYSDGTFMPDREKVAAIEHYEAQEYERYASGGRTRAARALRAADGTFLRELKE
jgi:hypothetical protein